MHIISLRLNLQAWGWETHNNNFFLPVCRGHVNRCELFLTWPETSVYKAVFLLQIPRLVSDQAEEIGAIPPRRVEVWVQIVALKVRPSRPRSSALERLISTVMRDTPGSVLSAQCATPLPFMRSSDRKWCVALELRVFSAAGTHAEPESPTEHELALYKMQIFFPLIVIDAHS